MSKAIANLWCGNLEPVKHLGENNSQIKLLEKLMEKNLEKLEKNLNENTKKTFGKYNDCVNEYLLEVSEQAFCDGFSLGIKIMSEALSYANEMMK